MAVLGILFLQQQVLPAQVLDLTEAITKGYLSVTATGLGGHSGNCLKLKLESRFRKKFELRIPAGQIFEAEDSLLQDLMISKEEIYALEPGKNRIAHLYGLCIEAHNISPDEGSFFSMGKMAEGNLLKVANYLNSNNLYDHPSAQYAVWSVSDDDRLENIGDQGLAKFIAELLGKPMPEYHIQYQEIQQDRWIPGQPANWREAFALNGLFYYSLNYDQKVNLGLYNEQGELVHYLFKNRVQRKGYHKFRFNFEIKGLSKGKYFVRMTSGDRILKELAVEF